MCDVSEEGCQCGDSDSRSGGGSVGSCVTSARGHTHPVKRRKIITIVLTIVTFMISTQSYPSVGSQHNTRYHINAPFSLLQHLSESQMQHT